VTTPPVLNSSGDRDRKHHAVQKGPSHRRSERGEVILAAVYPEGGSEIRRKKPAQRNGNAWWGQKGGRFVHPILASSKGVRLGLRGGVLERARRRRVCAVLKQPGKKHQIQSCHGLGRAGGGGRLDTVRPKIAGESDRMVPLGTRDARRKGEAHAGFVQKACQAMSFGIQDKKKAHI